MNLEETDELTPEMSASFGALVCSLLEQMNGGRPMLRADFSRLEPIIERRVKEELPRVFEAYRKARQQVTEAKGARDAGRRCGDRGGHYAC